MTNLKRIQSGDVVIAEFIFPHGRTTKRRPFAVISSDSIHQHGNLIVCPISSYDATNLGPGDLLLDPDDPNCRSTGLKKLSKIQGRSIFTVPRKYILGYCGTISALHRTRLMAEVKKALDLDRQ